MKILITGVAGFIGFHVAQKLIKDGENSNCATYIVAKKYYDIVDLTNDNNKPIYFVPEQIDQGAPPDHEDEYEKDEIEILNDTMDEMAI